jgi:hypothetical protein
MPFQLSLLLSLWLMAHRAMGHMSAPEPTTKAGVVWRQRTRVSAESLLIGKAGFGVEGRVAASDPSWMSRWVQSL